jgi:Berberine and berberine like
MPFTDVGSIHNDPTAPMATMSRSLVPWSDGGALVNFLAGPYVTPGHVRAAYAAADYSRLASIKTAWDPDNTFRFNHNIPPGWA